MPIPYKCTLLVIDLKSACTTLMKAPHEDETCSYLPRPITEFMTILPEAATRSLNQAYATKFSECMHGPTTNGVAEKVPGRPHERILADCIQSPRLASCGNTLPKLTNSAPCRRCSGINCLRCRERNRNATPTSRRANVTPTATQHFTFGGVAVSQRNQVVRHVFFKAMLLAATLDYPAPLNLYH